MYNYDDDKKKMKMMKKELSKKQNKCIVCCITIFRDCRLILLSLMLLSCVTRCSFFIAYTIHTYEWVIFSHLPDHCVVVKWVKYARELAWVVVCGCFFFCLKCYGCRMFVAFRLYTFIYHLAKKKCTLFLHVHCALWKKDVHN